MIFAPSFIEGTDKGEKSYEIFSMLQKERIVFIFDEITDDLAAVVIAQLILLEAADDKKDIQLYINSPGGSVTAGLAIYDTMRHIKCPVSTLCLGRAASMASLILAGGTKGKRYALENSEIMIHQVLGGAYGQATDIEITAKNIIRCKERTNKLLAKCTGKSPEQIAKDTDRDNYMTAEEAKEYGLIDAVID